MEIILEEESRMFCFSELLLVAVDLGVLLTVPKRFMSMEEATVAAAAGLLLVFFVFVPDRRHGDRLHGDRGAAAAEPGAGELANGEVRPVSLYCLLKPVHVLQAELRELFEIESPAAETELPLAAGESLQDGVCET
jgi:hypothetical protein